MTVLRGLRSASVWTALIWAFLVSVSGTAAEDWSVPLRSRSPEGTAQTKVETWNPARTAFIVCDVWDSHHCLNAVRRETEMIPRMNAVLSAARDRGALVIHAPSGCMKSYEKHPGRALAQQAPKAANLPADIGVWCYKIPAEEKGTYPVDQTDGGEDDDPVEHAAWHARLAAAGRTPKSPWVRQIETLAIGPRDPISDSGVEIWNLLEQNKIENVVVLGVHTNMCVLGRPFGLRQLAKNGKHVVLMRDMTDTMYNPLKWPFVTHYVGTDRVVEHIEKFVCPTITSNAIVGGEPFRFASDKRRIVMVIGDDEYKTEVTLPAFSKEVLVPAGFEVEFVHADATDRNHFPGLVEALARADVLWVSARRRLPKTSQLEALRQFVLSGKPVVGIRTASHAFARRAGTPLPEGSGEWPEFDPLVLGGHYTNHHGAGPATVLSIAPTAEQHPVLRQIDVASLTGRGSLYLVAPLNGGTTPLLIGTIPDKSPEPVAWTNISAQGGSRVFYTSLGHVDDFAQPAFRQLLLNGLCWTLDIAAPLIPEERQIPEHVKAASK